MGADTVKRACGLHGSGEGPRRGEPFEDVASKAVPNTAHVYECGEVGRAKATMLKSHRHCVMMD